MYSNCLSSTICFENVLLNRKMKKISLLLHLLMAFITVFRLVKAICHTEERRATQQEYICRRNYYGNNQCNYGYRVLNKTITCASIAATDVLLYTDDDDIGTNDKYPIVMKIIESQIPVWPASVFKNKEHLSELYMKDLGIQKLMPGSFNFVNNLTKLNLAGNELSTISDGIFNSLTLLKYLDVSRNHIENITEHAFVGIQLNELVLSENNISQLGQTLVGSLKNLVTLDLSNNKLKEVNNFNDLSLSNLYLSNNVLEYIDFKSLNNVQDIIDLSFNSISELKNSDLAIASKIILSNNNITQLDTYKEASYLNFSYNKLQEIGSDLFSSSLIEFCASDNFISTINADAFYNLTNLMVLVLKDNNLSSIPNSCFKDLHSLVFLDLSGNTLTYFTYGTFDGLTMLEKLDLSNNKLTDLHIHSLTNVQSLYIDNNNMEDLNIHDLLIQMQHLRVINLEGNNWYCKKLVYMVQTLKNNNVSFMVGESSEDNNVYGIKCKTDETLKLDGQFTNSTSNSFSDGDFTKTAMYNYFNADFKESNFFKYLENLRNIINDSYIEKVNAKSLQVLVNAIQSKPNDSYSDDFAKNLMYNYFNNSFRNTELFKYLDDFKNQTVIKNNLESEMVAKLEELIELLKKVIGKDVNYLSKVDFIKSDMYDYFNKGFKNSSFFKYLQTWNEYTSATENPADLDNSKMEKFVNAFEAEKISCSPNYIGILSFISVLLFLILCIITINTYINITGMKKYKVLNKENVELI